MAPELPLPYKCAKIVFPDFSLSLALDRCMLNILKIILHIMGQTYETYSDQESCGESGAWFRCNAAASQGASVQIYF